MKAFFIILLGVFLGLVIVRGFMLDSVEEIGFRFFLEALSNGKLDAGDITEISKSATFTKFLIGAIIGAILGGFVAISLVINSPNRAKEFGSVLVGVFSIIVFGFIAFIGIISVKPKAAITQYLPQQINTQSNSIKHVSGVPSAFFKVLDNEYANNPDIKAIAVVNNEGILEGWAAGYSYGNYSEEQAQNNALMECKKRAAQSNIQGTCRVYAVGKKVIFSLRAPGE